LGASEGEEEHQILVSLGLAKGGSNLVRSVTNHALTAIWLVEEFLPVGFELVPRAHAIRLITVA
jgi:RNA 3'-terminal phosphate cyclase